LRATFSRPTRREFLTEEQATLFNKDYSDEELQLLLRYRNLANSDYVYDLSKRLARSLVGLDGISIEDDIDEWLAAFNLKKVREGREIKNVAHAYALYYFFSLSPVSRAVFYARFALVRMHYPTEGVFAKAFALRIATYRRKWKIARVKNRKRFTTDGQKRFAPTKKTPIRNC